MTKHSNHAESSHFKGKDALGHVVEAQAQGIAAGSEIHGTEIPGHISAGADSARETAIVLLLLSAVLVHLAVPVTSSIQILAIFGLGWLLWKTGRSGWLGWSRLERLHRVIVEEKWEIDHHRKQERAELRVLYHAKGFEGKLLEEVLDVLMADGDRLLRVMVEEELGLSLGVHEHPLKQALGAALGVAIASTVCLLGFYIDPTFGVISGAFLTVVVSAAVSAKFEGNREVPAVVWNAGLLAVAFGSVHFLFIYFSQG